MRTAYDGPVFIHQFELAVTPHEARILTVRLDMARQFYNAMLGEAHKRRRQCRQDPRWAAAVALLQAGKPSQARPLFRAITQQYGYSELGLNDVASAWRQNVLREHLDSQTCYDIAKRAFRACETFHRDRTHTPGRRRRVRFPRRGDYHTISSNTIKIDPATRQIRWWGLTLPYRLDPKDADQLQAYVLAIMQEPDNIRMYGKRITRRIIRGEPRFYLQITLKGQPFQKAKHPVRPGSVGIDLGPSTVAIVTGDTEHGLTGELRTLAEGCQRDERAVRRLQRYLDRSRRATNPQCFDAQGRSIPGQRITVRSRRYQAAERRLIEVERRLAERRKRAHNALVHAILAKGTAIKAEDLSYKGWQRGLFGKSIGRRSAGAFLARLKQQAETVGGTFTAIPTRQTKFSQLCHGCGTYTKKPLSLRVHQCACGVGPVQRDIYSAFLAHQFSGDTSFDLGAVRTAFTALHGGATGVDSAPVATRKQACLASPCPPETGKSGAVANGVERNTEVHARTARCGGGEKVVRDTPPSQSQASQTLPQTKEPHAGSEVRARGAPQHRRGPPPRRRAQPTTPPLPQARSPQTAVQLLLFQEDT